MRVRGLLLRVMWIVPSGCIVDLGGSTTGATGTDTGGSVSTSGRSTISVATYTGWCADSTGIVGVWDGGTDTGGGVDTTEVTSGGMVTGGGVDTTEVTAGGMVTGAMGGVTGGCTCGTSSSSMITPSFGNIRTESWGCSI